MVVYTTFNTDLKSLVSAGRKRMWDWGQQQDALQQERLAVKQLQVLGIFDPTLPTKLDVPATQEKSGCELGQL